VSCFSFCVSHCIVSVVSNGLCVQNRHAQDPSPQFIRNYFSAFANDPILTSVRGVEKLEAGTPDGESDEKEKVEEMEKDAFVTRCVFYGRRVVVVVVVVEVAETISNAP